ncbi:MAG: hypothetical protein NTY09_14175 [bacterium]|nr:hypothetical protein [bacterium]
MKRIVFIAMALCLSIVISPRASSTVYMDYEFPDGVVWTAGNFETYDILMRNEVVGESRVDYSQMTMMDEPAYRIEWDQTWTDLDGAVNSVSSDSKMRAGNLRVLISTLAIKVNDEEWQYEGNYTGNDLLFGAYLPGVAERQESSLSRGGLFCDADALPFLLRNIPFEEGNFTTLTVVDVSSHRFITPIAKVTGSEIVETSTTQYDCWTVAVTLGNTAFTAWYSKNDKHYLVRLRYSDRDLVLNHHS